MNGFSLHDSCTFVFPFSTIHVSILVADWLDTFVGLEPFLGFYDDDLFEVIGTNPGSPESSHAGGV